MTRRIRVTGVLAGITLAVCMLWGPAVGAAAVPAPVAPTMALVARPAWVGPEDSVSFRVRLGGDLDGARVRVEVRSRVADTAELTRSAEENTGELQFRTTRMPLEDLAPTPAGVVDLPLQITVTSTPGAARLDSPGVYPVVLTLYDDNGEASAVVRTPLVRIAPGAESRPVAVLVDARVGPTLQPDGQRSIGAIELLRLRHLVALDPVARGYTVLVPPDTLDGLEDSPAPAARLVLDVLQGADALAVTDQPVSADALVDAGIGDLVPRFFFDATSRIADQLGTAPRSGFWEPSTQSPPAAVLVLVADTVVVDDAVVPALAPTPAAGASAVTPAGPYPVEGLASLRAVVTSTALSDALSAPAGSAVDAPHWALAALALGDGPVVVRVRDVADRPVLAELAELLADDGAPARLGGFDVVAADVAGTEGPAISWTGPAPPDLGDVAARALDADAAIDTARSVAPDRTADLQRWHAHLVAALATPTPEEDRSRHLDQIERDVGDLLGGIGLVGQTDLNLTSRSGDLPVTVRNDTGAPVRVRVRVRSERLSFPHGDTIDVEAPPGTRRLDIQVEALATGSVPVFVELWTPDGELLLATRTLNIRSTAISGVGLAISVGALAVLVFWWYRTWRGGHRDPDDDPGTDDPDRPTSRKRTEAVG